MHRLDLLCCGLVSHRWSMGGPSRFLKFSNDGASRNRNSSPKSPVRSHLRPAAPGPFVLPQPRRRSQWPGVRSIPEMSDTSPYCPYTTTGPRATSNFQKRNFVLSGIAGFLASESLLKKKENIKMLTELLNTLENLNKVEYKPESPLLENSEYFIFRRISNPFESRFSK